MATLRLWPAKPFGLIWPTPLASRALAAQTSTFGCPDLMGQCASQLCVCVAGATPGRTAGDSSCIFCILPWGVQTSRPRRAADRPPRRSAAVCSPQVFFANLKQGVANLGLEPRRRASFAQERVPSCGEPWVNGPLDDPAPKRSEPPISNLWDLSTDDAAAKTLPEDRTQRERGARSSTRWTSRGVRPGAEGEVPHIA